MIEKKIAQKKGLYFILPEKVIKLNQIKEANNVRAPRQDLKEEEKTQIKNKM